MRKEWLIQLFLMINKSLFGLFSIFPSRKKVVFLCDFGDNANHTIKSLLHKDSHKIVVLKTAKCTEDFSQLKGIVTLNFEFKHLFDYIKGIYHIATSKKLLIDNYVPILTAIPKHIECIQLWHAAGAIKKFALSDPSISYRSPKAVQRFREVYDRMDKIVVGSEQMSKIFRLALHKEPDAFLRTGIPRTDFYFDEPAMMQARRELVKVYPQIVTKKVLLYAPTFRDFELQSQAIPINFSRIMDELGDDYLLLVKLHPAVKQSMQSLSHERIIVLDNHVPIHKLLTVTEFLISDYSSIPFEFAFFNKPQIFYPYDLDQYRMSRGFWSEYATMVPGPVVDSDDELIHTILHMDFDARVIEDYSAQWNTFSKGNSADQLAEYIVSS